MAAYFYMISFVIAVLILGRFTQKVVYVENYGQREILPSVSVVMMIFLILGSFYTFRWCNGTDFFNYYMSFYSEEATKTSFITEQRDVMYGLVTYIFRNYLTDNFLIYNAFLAFLTYMPLIFVLRKYSENFNLSILLYIFTTMYFVPYNTVRQGIAVGIFMWGYSFFLNKKYVAFFLLSAIAFMFHPVTAIPVIILFVCRREFLSSIVTLVAGGMLITGIALPSIWRRVINFLSIVGQEKIAADYENALGVGRINILRILVALVPLVLALIEKKYMKRLFTGVKKDHVSLCMNMSVFNVLFVAVGLYNPIFARVSQFFEVFLLFLYPALLEAYEKRSKILVATGILIMYFIFMIYSLKTGGNLIPYQINTYSLHGEIVNLN